MAILEKDIAENLKIEVVDTLWRFIEDQDGYDLALSWLDKGYIHPKGKNDKNLFTLSTS